jgi:sialic acid synthase SpsE
MYIVADVGSTHQGKWKYLTELIDVCAGCGVDVVKLQLFGKEHEQGGNVCLPRDWVKPAFQYAKEHNIAMSASVFDKEALEIMFAMETPFIKFAYSMREDAMVMATISRGKKCVVSTDPMSLSKVPEIVRNNPCYAPLFRLPGPPEMIYPTLVRTNYEGLFPPFIGLSDHSLGCTEAIEAAQFGCEFFEKHITLNYNDITCPDAAFALKPKQLEQFVRKIKYESFGGPYNV